MRRLESRKRTEGFSRTQYGFSLIELLVVVAVILIIAAIAIPNYISAKMRANESAAVQNLRNIASSELVYSSTYGVGYTTALAQLVEDPTVVDANHAGLIDQVLAGGTKGGYTYTYAVSSTDSLGNPSGYSLTASPLVPRTTGLKYFFVDQSSVIRFNLTTTAGSTDSPI